MRKLFTTIAAIAVAALALPASAGAQVYPDRIKHAIRHADYQARERNREELRAQQVDKFTKTVKVGATGEILVQNIAGDITVTRGTGEAVTVNVVRTARGRDDADAKEQLQLVQADISERNGRVEIRERYPERGTTNRRTWNLTTDFTITAPAGAQVTVKSVSGDIKISDIKGEVSAETVSGDVRLSGLGRLADAKSVSGTVDVADTQVDGTLDANSVSGDVVARRVKAERLDLTSVSGNVVIEDVQCDRVSAHTTAGNTRFTGQLAKGGRYELKSFSGEVRLVLSGTTGFEVDASSFSGDVRSDLPLTTRGSESGRRMRQRLSGTYGDGSASLQLTTFSGSVVITKK